MDSITQATLGGAIGHICWHETMGRKALIAGLLLGTLPDLDIVMYPFLDEVQRLYWHRGESHSVWFILLGSIGIGWLLNRNYPSRQLEQSRTAIGVFLILSTHVLIDLFNVYGTQLLAPVSRKGFALNNMFIIDPLFTLPLLMGVVSAYFLNKEERALRINSICLLLAVLYIAWSLTAQSLASSKFRQALSDQNISVIRQITSAGPFSTLLWRNISETPNGFLLGYWSFLDSPDQEISFHFIPKNAAAVGSILSTRTFRAIDWFSQGWWFVANSDRQSARVVDLRFIEIPTGTGLPIDRLQWPFAWTFNLNPEDEIRLKAIAPSLHNPLAPLRLFSQRTLGQKGWLPASR